MPRRPCPLPPPRPEGSAPADTGRGRARLGRAVRARGSHHVGVGDLPAVTANAVNPAEDRAVPGGSGWSLRRGISEPAAAWAGLVASTGTCPRCALCSPCAVLSNADGACAGPARGHWPSQLRPGPLPPPGADPGLQEPSQTPATPTSARGHRGHHPGGCVLPALTTATDPTPAIQPGRPGSAHAKPGGRTPEQESPHTSGCNHSPTQPFALRETRQTAGAASVSPSVK